MLYIHENNFDTKINTTIENKKQVNGYHNLKPELTSFKHDYYIPFKNKMLQIEFDAKRSDSFKEAASVINNYALQLSRFISTYKITSQCKLESTLLEELSVYLFKDIPEIKNHTFGIFNKKIYAGLKIDSNHNLTTINKDVDFCIGKKSIITIDRQSPIEIIVPIVAVECKTYMDATMFGEIKSSSKAIKSASPNAKAYVLMGYKDLADEHIIAARQDSTLDELFALKKSKNSEIDYHVLFDYWTEIRNAISSVAQENVVPKHGRLLNTNNS